MTLRRIRFPLVFACSNRPFALPPMLLSSMRLPELPQSTQHRSRYCCWPLNRYQRKSFCE